MSKNVPNVPAADGNTKPAADNGQYRYCFTFNNYEERDVPILYDILKEHCKKFVFQEEKGDVEGTKHLQGSIWLKSKKRLDWLKNNLNHRIHWEKMRNQQASIDYCQKEDTRVGKVYKFGFPNEIKIITNLLKWQCDLETEIMTNEPNDRTVTWIVDRVGGAGKTQFVKYMLLKHINKVFLVRGSKASDVYNQIINQDLNDVRAIFIDVPRESAGVINMQAIECIKDGMIVNTKYETGMKIFNSPHVIVFSNNPPNIKTLSFDRWDIRKYKDGELQKVPTADLFGIDPEEYDWT